MGTERARIVSIIGTRPEAIKMTPVIRTLAAHPGLTAHVVLTGQHPGLRARFAFLPDGAVTQLAVDLGEQSAGEVREVLHYRLLRSLLGLTPALVLVHGDTTSALAGALAARDLDLPLGHVEAGLRSGDRLQPWPEEGNRIAIDALADLLFAPTAAAAANLAAEPDVAGAVHITGNSGIDALLATHAALPPARSRPHDRKRILVTCHRRENRGETLRGIADALRRLAETLPVEIVLPLHPNGHVRRPIVTLLAGAPGIRLLEPLDYRQMVAELARCWLILTDSGGLQEEAPALGKPVLVLRNVTERCEGLETESLRLVGTDPEAIVAAVTALHDDPACYARMARRSFPFGDGHAAPRIAAIVADFLAGRGYPVRRVDPETVS